MADSREKAFQKDIITALNKQGWLVGKTSNYDRVNALYPKDLLAYFQEAWPERWEKFCKANPNHPEKVLIQKTVRELEKVGTLSVLRHGFKVPGVTIKLCSFQPDHGMNPDTERRYQANRLRVVEEVSYSPHAREGEYNPRLDLVLYVNGIPTATLELKSEFKQTVEHAKRQYKKDRPVKDPLTQKKEPLLSFERGALVHFAVSQDEVAMTTRLAGQNTSFLPFNKGKTDGGAGNPQPENDREYATGYLWEQVFCPDAWLKVIGRFLHIEKTVEEDFHGRRQTKKNLIFPRFHQWDVVNKLVHATKEEGAGKKYLIQHSAGSGKSNSIAWAAHQLASLYDDQGSKLFNSIIVVTDRTVLDSQLQETIYQFEHAQGVVRPINHELSNQSKSEQLAEALEEGTRIIIVTIQTFPALFDALDKRPSLAEGSYAVIADEAHSSQTGSAASKLKSILGSHKPVDEEVSAEELLDAAVSARKPTERISYYAFTATPKAKTLELFGRPANPDEPASSDNKPGPFHLYSMQQAIEEGFILDVLQRYTTYATAWKLAHPHADDTEVESRKASAKLARWVRLHPYNIQQKVEVIVEHYRENVRYLLDGNAKAMVVTGSRQEAVRYALAMRQYVKEQDYVDVHPLVAFSGSVQADEIIPEEVTESSPILNPGLNGRDLAKAFDTEDYNVMIAANKYQTGFDQPKLCAMYVDKKLQGVDCVQTLSRLNRLYPGKEIFVLDFYNNTDDVLAAFAPYYRNAELEDISDPQVVYDLQRTLDSSGIYHQEEIDAFALAFYDSKAPSSKLSYYCHPAKDRFGKRYKIILDSIQSWQKAKKEAEVTGNKTAQHRAEQELKDANTSRDELDLFRRNLNSFVRIYEFLSQIVDYDDTDLEKLCVFAKHLHPLLRIDRLDDDKIDVSELALTHYRLTKRAEKQLKLEDEEGKYDGLKPISEVGSGKPHDPDKQRLSEIIEKLNDLFGAEISDEDKLHFANGIAERVTRDEDVMAQVNSHSADQVMHGLFPKKLTDLVLDSMTENEQMSLEILGDEEKQKEFALVILRIILNTQTSPANP